MEVNAQIVAALDRLMGTTSTTITTVSASSRKGKSKKTLRSTSFLSSSYLTKETNFPAIPLTSHDLRALAEKWSVGMTDPAIIAESLTVAEYVMLVVSLVHSQREYGSAPHKRLSVSGSHSWIARNEKDTSVQCKARITEEA